MKKILIALCITVISLLLYSNTPLATLVQGNLWNKNSGIPILMYHHILAKDENPFGDNGSIISLESFAKQMEYLHNNDYNTITLKEVEKYLAGEATLPPKSLLLTFDDGYLSNYIYAYPILKEYNFKGTIFMITDWINEVPEEFNPNVLNYLSWEEMDQARDVFEYASHTHNLHHLTPEGESFLTAKPLEEVREDLQLTQELLGTTSFAYPYGFYNQDILELLEDLGFTMAFTTEEGRVNPGDPALELKRYGVYPYTTMSKFKEMVQ